MLLAQPKSARSDETAHSQALGQASAGGVPQPSPEVPGRPFRQGQSNQFLKLLNAKINLLIALLHSIPYISYYADHHSEFDWNAAKVLSIFLGTSRITN